MVQLKVENVYAELQYQRKFQFLMVQLKVFTNGHNLSVKPISIPNGSIKRQKQSTDSPKQSDFNS